MTTIIPEPSHASREPGQLVEMAWDPITRIVGGLGIYTKIDFEKKEAVECHSTPSIFRGYSIFMKGKDPRDAHFITSRSCGICGDNHATCSVYNQNMAYGVVAPPNRGVLERANPTEAPHAAEHGYRTIGDIMRSLNPLEGEFYREALAV